MKRLWLLVVVLLVACAVEAPERTDTSRARASTETTYPVAFWERAAAAPARFDAVAAYDEARRTLVTYGGTFGSAPVSAGDDTCLLDLHGWTCPVLAPADHPTFLTASQMAYDPVHRKVVLFGGQAFNGAYADTWTWDGARWTKSTATPSPPGRKRAVMKWVPSIERIVLFGGLGDSGPLDDTWLWDGGAWTRVGLDVHPSARWITTAVYHQEAKHLLLFGGSDTNDNLDVTGDTWTFDGTWKQVTSPGPPARNAGVAVYDESRKQIVMTGGGLANTFDAGDTWLWDGTAWTEAKVPGPDYPRSGFHLAYDPERKNVLFYGGSLGDDAWIWDGAAWKQVSGGPGVRGDGTLLWDPQRKVLVLTGGTDGAFGTPSDTWTWDGTAWKKLTDFIAPPARRLPFHAYDTERKRFVVYGGNDDSALDDTWTWDGALWEKMTPATAPSARTQGAFAWDPVRKVMLIHGGGSSLGIFNESWTWNGTTWAKVPGAQPPARYDATMTFDTTHGVAVLFGGTAPDGTFLDDSWTFDGTAWKTIPGPRPPKRARAGIVDDPAIGKVVLFGGENGPGNDQTLADTWVFDGTGWTEVAKENRPAARGGVQLTYDPEQKTLLLFGGYTFTKNTDRFFDDAFTFDGASWTPVTGGPLGRAFGQMVYDPDHRHIVLAGGLAASDPPADTWFWNGTWSQARAPAGQPAVWAAASGYDAANRAMVVFGGVEHGVLAPTSLSAATWRLTSFGDACTTSCALGTCVDGACTRDEGCTSCERADGAERGRCTSVRSGVDPDTCDGTKSCDAEGACREVVGRTCDAATDCSTGFCVDGVCCESACSGQCEACDVPGAAGRCQPIRGRPHGTRAHCAGEDAVSDICAKPACNGVIADRCEGTIGPCAPFACTLQGCSTKCATDADCDAASFCDVAIAVCRPKSLDAPVCDGEHSLVSATFRQDCTPYRCDGASCLDRCQSARDCTSPFECSRDGTCVPPLTNREATGGCSIGDSGEPRTGGALVFGLVLLALLARRRRALLIPGVAIAAACSTAEPPTSSARASSALTASTARTAGWERIASPGFRAYSAMAWDGARHQIVLFGGYAGLAGLFNDTCVYDTPGGWRCIDLPASARPPSRSRAQMFYDAQRRKIVLVGGVSDTGALDDTWLWDGVSWEETKLTGSIKPSITGPAVWHDKAATAVYFDGTRSSRWDGFGWEAMTEAPGPREDANAIYDAAREHVVLVGGTANGTALDETWLFDGLSWKNGRPATKPTARSRAQLVWDGARVVLFGGLAQTGFLDDTWTWDGTTWSKATGPSPPARYDASFGWDAKHGRGVLFGGRTNDPLGDTWLFDGTTWTKAAPTAGPSPRYGGSLVWDPDGQRLVFFGGRDASTVWSDTWAWDGDLGTWVDVTRRLEPPARFRGLSVYDEKRQEMVVYGGQGPGFSDILDDTWTFDGLWHDRGKGLLGPRTGTVMVRDVAHDQTILFGGMTGLGDPLRSDTWIWNGTSWTKGPAGPDAREEAVMAYDPIRERVVLFGGKSGTIASGTTAPRNDTWLWDGAGWTKADVAVSPPPRQGGMFVWDAKRKVLVLFSGLGSPNFLSDTWTWDGKEWTEAPSPTHPEGRFYGHAIYDPVHENILFFAGESVTLFAATYDDTWTWDGTWTKFAGLSPPSRKGATLVFDSDLKEIVLHGGEGSVNLLDDTWVWNGTWTPATATSSPGPRSRASAVYDPKSKRTILVGGHPQGDFGGFALSGTYALTLRGLGCVKDTDCVHGTCVDGTCCAQDSCTTCERCDNAKRPGICTGVRGDKDADSCAACDPIGRCKTASGQTCTSGLDCATGFCADGVCCSGACTGQCEACDNAGAVGICQPVRGRPHGTRAVCGPDNAVDLCATVACDGVEVSRCAGTIGPCTPYSCTSLGCSASCTADTDCDRNATCDVAAKRCRPSPTDGPLCDGKHTILLDTVVTTECSPYACEGTACKTSCTSANDCAYPFECSRDGACVPPLDNVAAVSGCTTAPGSDSSSHLAFGFGLMFAGLLRGARRRASTATQKS